MKNNKTDPRFLPIIFQSIPHGIFTVDASSRINSFNRAAEEITGYSSEEAIGKVCSDIFRADICQKKCPMKQSLNSRTKTENRQVQIVNRSGEPVTISICTAALLDTYGNIVGAVEMFRNISHLIALEEQLHSKYSLKNIVTKNNKMKELLDRLPLFANSPSTVLIEGESGTGKELIARALHNLGPRSGRPFIKINCAALPDNLLESELFGYCQGAFTGAAKDKPGRFQLAHTGSILLDEIGNISAAMQTKLLRVLQEREFEPLGSTQTIKVDVRVIAATNMDLAEEVAAGRFRQDLYYRLNVIRVDVPPLNQRPEDIPLLISHFIYRFNQLQGKYIERVSRRALRALMGADWPGNIRELENAIEYAFALCTEPVIDVIHLPPQYSKSDPVKIANASLLKSAEADIIIDTLKQYHSNRLQTAKALGISRNTLWRKMKRYGIQ